MSQYIKHSSVASDIRPLVEINMNIIFAFKNKAAGFPLNLSDFRVHKPQKGACCMHAVVPLIQRQ